MLALKTRRFVKYSALLTTLAGSAWLVDIRNSVDSLAVVRLSRAAVTVFKIATVYKANLYNEGLEVGSEEYFKVKNCCHQLGAEQLLELCYKNRGVYIKVGQHIAALDYLLPKEYVQTMKVLHSHVPISNLEDVYKVIKQDLKKDAHELFAEFDENPLGTASLAQVHKAVLSDDSVVAIKVQHPYVREYLKVDMKTMEVLVKIVSWAFPEFKFQWMVDETKKSIRQELNFELEGRNAEKVAEMFKGVHWLKIPKIRWEYSTSRVLTMEFLEGGQVNDIDYIKKNKIDPFEISDKLGRLYSQMIFINGFVHSDPHPGNILVKKTEKGCDIILLDHGLYATLSRSTMVDYASLWLGILARNQTMMRRHSTNLGVEGNLYGLLACMLTGRTWDSIKAGIDKQKPSKDEKELFQKEFGHVLPDISVVLDRVNRELILIMKTNELMRGIEYALRTSARMGSFRVMSKCCIRSVYGQKIDEANGRLKKAAAALAQYWLLFKLNIYYTFLSLKLMTVSLL